MIEDIRIKIHSVRFEVEASLFSDETDGEEFAADREAEPETVEINTVGKLRRENGRVEVSYEETEVTGMEGSTTAVTYAEGQEAPLRLDDGQSAPQSHGYGGECGRVYSQDHRR